MYECLFVCHVGMSNENEGKCMEMNVWSLEYISLCRKKKVGWAKKRTGIGYQQNILSKIIWEALQVDWAWEDFCFVLESKKIKWIKLLFNASYGSNLN